VNLLPRALAATEFNPGVPQRNVNRRTDEVNVLFFTKKYLDDVYVKPAKMARFDFSKNPPGAAASSTPNCLIAASQLAHAADSLACSPVKAYSDAVMELKVAHGAELFQQREHGHVLRAIAQQARLDWEQHERTHGCLRKPPASAEQAAVTVRWTG